MKTYSDDLPNITKEDLARAASAAEGAADIAKATLAAQEDTLHTIKQQHAGEMKNLRTIRWLLILNAFLVAVVIAFQSAIIF